MKSILKPLVLSILCFGITQINNFKYIQVPGKYRLQQPGKEERREILKSLDSPYYLESCLPANFVKDGTIDYTKFIQNAMDTHRCIIFPDFPLLINKAGLDIKSNSIVYFQKSSKLILEPNDLMGYQILNISNAHNVKIYYPNIQGDKEQHLNSRAAWGFGISIRGSEYVLVEKAEIASCAGDGIYIGGTSKPSQNIQINGGAIDNCKRNGLSVTSAINVKIESLLVSNTNGMSPGSGIDIEPNTNFDEIKDILLNNIITFNNMHWGILINTVNLRKGENVKIMDINVNNHIDDNSDYGMAIWTTARNKKGKDLSGAIDISNAKWINNRTQGYQYFDNDEFNDDVKLNLKNIRIFKTQSMSAIDDDQIGTIKKKFIHNKNFSLIN